MELYKIVDASESLIKLAKQDLPIRSAFMLQTLIDSLREHTQNFSAQHARLLNKYGVAVPEKAGTYNIPLENSEKYNNELNSLLTTDVSLPDSKIQIKMNDNLIMTAADIACTLPFIEYIEN